MEKVVILGSGPAGYTAAIYAARAGLAPVVITGKRPGGLLTQTGEVENFPGFPEGVDGTELMLRMQAQAERFGAKIEIANAGKVTLTDGGTQKIELEDARVIECEALIIATGASPRWLGLASEERLRNRGVSACATCDGAFYRNQEVLVAGGGDSAMEEALFLSRLAKSVTVIHRRDTLRASKIMAERAMKNDKIKFVWNAEIIEVLGEKAVEGVKVRDANSHEERVIPGTGLFVALGHVPETKLFQGQLDLDGAGYIKLAPHTTATGMRGVFAAGDCAAPKYRQAITAAGAGAQAAMDAEEYLAGNMRYEI